MSLQQKMRLLSAWLPAGLPHFEAEVGTYLHLQDVPYELENILARWLLLHPELTDRELPTCVLIEGGKGLAISRDGWENFVCWLVETLRTKLDDMEQDQPTQ
ncbi:hypothetical protein [Cupriavidus consociatus]|uniref:hypothetical protein n=1 Tax=Cupriavidus consociatus TaxID=2821357 RepID=UPI001AE75805|nr:MULTISPECIES: hypothetical protein [unclassified Cupriavidus]MBP0619346.1 hypothetical protein [Cupriavidus sp. LEh25]MDK2655994.1 hypothetical protein [Cupriavidus sp. LEh21]